MKTGDDAWSFEHGGSAIWRVGSYKVTHLEGTLGIERFLTPNPLKDGTECQIIYDASGPKRMLLRRNTPYTFLFVTFSVGTMKPWKNPAP
ncbi:hypothetical protein SAMN05216548_101543 [Faunimonas pinastri]|uniref:Uncharacterized protein n=1 Tax=Faunimonas pinastri TaxID=1855383 RepID=A0A1H9AWS8_9HYPH|nr:hypothetical protein SAMN05216548_101543 [Faunimonas pinastri]